MMIRKKREAADSENQVSPQIDSLLLIDREVDLLTPLFTQLTYEGLIDELYGIQNSKSVTRKKCQNFALQMVSIQRSHRTHVRLITIKKNFDT